MSGIFTRERFGRPQILAGILLLAFAAECAWLIAHETPAVISTEETVRVQEGLEQWHGGSIAGTPASGSPDFLRMRANVYDPQHSPLWYLIEAAPVALFRAAPDSRTWLWLTRIPYVFVGGLLGASLWYVSRRLYGNAGGYIALTLYCSSPAVLRSSTLWFAQPNVVGAWGSFGAVFTAIAVSHTLYAPREVVLWNWRRILLLGISLALAIGSQFSLVIVLPLLLVAMLYLAPERRAAALAIFAVALAVALVLLCAAYFFHLRVFWNSVSTAQFLDANGYSLRMLGAYKLIAQEIVTSGPVLAVLVPAALIAYFVWRRSRYFGNTAPLLFAAVFVLLAILSPHEPDSVFPLLASIFLFVFVSGMSADLLETKARELGRSLLGGLLAANAIWNLIGLSRLGR